MSKLVYRVPGDAPSRPLALLKEASEFGFSELDLIEPPSRFLVPGGIAGVLRTGVDAERADVEPDPVDLLDRLGSDESAMTQTRRSLAKLFAWFLLAEDPQRRLEARPVETLAHQASVVRHILAEEELRSVLLADEVGLGKTIEAGLLVKELLETSPSLRVLYLAPAGLVRNVFHELDRLGLPFRRWVSGIEGEARPTDQLVLASIHRAVHPAHSGRLLEAPPWDFVIIDECHHLSDWQKGGGKPTEKYKLAKALSSRLGPSGRLLLMSGTPHQGHPDRFENLLMLLRRGEETRAALAGRVIYRTKDVIQDWDGRPVFPRREVHPPLLVNLGEDYRHWLERVYEVFAVDGRRDESIGQARRRALDWRSGQALQWATSSIQAGLGYLVRQAIRAGWELDQGALRASIAALRPYRSGAVDEPVGDLFERLRAEVGCSDDLEDLEDLDEDDADDGRWRPSPVALELALSEGLKLLKTQADAKWQVLTKRVLDEYGDEKVVLFAQPIETVTALAGYLEKLDGRRPAMIIGGQTQAERMAQVEAFRKEDGPRFLVSSKAGGEGLNLQVARILVHVDVPWNPMDLEQRVGRVHRFLSKRTIQVHTLVAKDSREVHIYSAAREKLRKVASTLDSQHFEELFGRVMALVPPEELSGVLVRGAVGPLEDQDVDALGQLVAAGYRRWEKFHDEFAESQQRIRGVAAGGARHEDLMRFAKDHLGARDSEALPRLRFREEGGEVVEASDLVEIVEIEGKPFACGDHGGSPVMDKHGTRAGQLGVNLPFVQEALRRLGLGNELGGGAHIQLARGSSQLPRSAGPSGLLVYARSVLSLEGVSCREIGLELRAFFVDAEGEVSVVGDGQIGPLVRELLDAKVRREAARPAALIAAMRKASERLAIELRRPPDRGKRHALFPLLAAIVEPP
jgi:superfamily II DNA or RNA helicase